MNHIDARACNQPGQPRTSITDPLRIAELQPVGFTGRLGITLCPGKQGDSVYGRPWQRDLTIDLDVIEAWGACAIMTLIEHHEFDSLGVVDLGARIQERRIEWLHLPIVDLKPPGKSFESKWSDVAAQIRNRISGSERVLVHCRGGLGRAGTIAACILIELGATPTDAIGQVRRVRPHAIQTAGQERYVLNFSASAGSGTRT